MGSEMCIRDRYRECCEYFLVVGSVQLGTLRWKNSSILGLIFGLVQVVRAHDGESAQQCQKIVKESYACRTFDQNFTHRQMEVLVADAMRLLAHCPRTPVRPRFSTVRYP